MTTSPAALSQQLGRSGCGWPPHAHTSAGRRAHCERGSWLVDRRAISAPIVVLPSSRSSLRRLPAADPMPCLALPAGAASTSALQLVSAAAVPVAKVALYCAVGAWASSRGLLSPEGRRIISSLTLYIFTPCLLFSKLAVGVGVGEVARLWVVSANMVASHVVGLLLGLLAARWVRVPERLRNQLVLSCGVGNVGNLPFVLLAGLAVDPALPFAAALGPAVASEMAMRYVALSNLTAALIQFPLTYIFMQKPAPSNLPPPPNPPSPPSPSLRQQDPGPQLAKVTSSSSSSSIRSSTSGGVDCSVGHGTVDDSTGSSSRDGSSRDGSSSRDDSSGDGSSSSPATLSPAPPPATRSALDDTAGPSRTSTSTSSQSASSSASFPPSGSRWQSLAAGVFTPPTVFSLLAVVVASVGWLKDALFSPTGCLRLLGEVSDALGAVCIPALLLVLGANLSRGPGVAAGRLPASCVVAAVATRLLLLPAVCGALLVAAWSAGMLPGTDPLAMLVMLVMHATPTAVLVHSMATIFGNAEDEVAALLFWQYAASLVTLPLAIGAMLQLLGPAAATREAWLGAPIAARALATAVAGGA